jgi:hypothetical protein
MHPSTTDDEVRGLLALMANAAAHDQRDLSEVLRALRPSWPHGPEATIRLVLDLVGSDQALSRARDAIAGAVRTAIAVDAMTDTLAGEPVIIDPSVLDDMTRVARVRGEAHRAVMQLPMLTSVGVAQVMGSGAKNREVARSLRERGRVIGLPDRASFVYPAFQFDPDRHAVWPAVATINDLIDARHDPWGVAGWWITPDRILGGRPVDFVGDPDRDDQLISAAQAVVEPIG